MVQPLIPGVMVCCVVAVAAAFLSEHYHAPVMLFALLLGMGINFLSTDTKCQPGIEFSSRTLLRVGVALLGLRITFAHIQGLGWWVILWVVVSILLTIAFGAFLARLMHFKTSFGILTGGATAICGASAALALSAALPQDGQKEKATLLTVIGVSGLSTLAMVLYPIIVQWTHMDFSEAGIFLGATIHDVAQVVGAGYAVSPETGDAATVVKLLRVAMLLPTIIITTLYTRRWLKNNHNAALLPAAGAPPLLPGFVLVFITLVVLGSLGWLPHLVVTQGQEVSKWCLIIAISAIGMKTHLKDVLTLGIKPVLLMVVETLFIAILVLLAIKGTAWIG